MVNPFSSFWSVRGFLSAKTAALFIAFFLLLQAISAQVADPGLRVQGRVTDASNGEALRHVAVFVHGSGGVAYTDEAGDFDLGITSVPATLLVRRIGYSTDTVALGDVHSALQLSLKPEPFEFAELLVVGEPSGSIVRSELLIDGRLLSAQPRDVGDLFRATPGFGLIRRGGYAMDPVFRGFKYEQLNVQYDGGIQVFHACPNRMDPITTHVSPQEIDQVELVKGPYSVRFGPTLGGVINLITEQVRFSEEAGGKMDVAGVVSGGYESNGNSWITRANLSAAQDRWGFVLGGSVQDFGNYKSGDGTEIPSSFRSYDYVAKLGWKPAEGHRLVAGWRQSFARDVLHAGLPMDTESDDSWIASLDYRFKSGGDVLSSVDVKAWWSQVDHVMSNTERPNYQFVHAVTPVTSRTIGGKAEAKIVTGNKLVLYTGVDAHHLDRSGTRERTVVANMMTGEPIDPPKEFLDPVWQESQQQGGGVWLEARLLSNEKLTWTFGLRGDLYVTSIDEPAPDFAALYPDLDPSTAPLVSANATMNWRPTEAWMLEVALGRGMRAPNLEEHYINHFTIGPDGYEYVGNPYLNPEANHQFDLAVSRTQGRLEASIGGFVSYVSNYITAVVDSTLPRKYMPNLEPKYSRRYSNTDAFLTGFEAAVEWNFVRYFHAFGSISYTWAQDLNAEDALAEIPPLEGSVGLRYQRPKWWVEAKGRFVADQNRISESFDESRSPGFAVYDFRVGWQPLEWLDLGASLLNAFDRNYYEHLNRVYRNSIDHNGPLYEPGLNLALHATFFF